MRIISPFHDYYDTAIGWASDENQFYHRVSLGTGIDKFPEEIFHRPVWRNYGHDKLKVRATWVGIGRRAFLRWVIGPVLPREYSKEIVGYTSLDLVKHIYGLWRSDVDIGSFYDEFFAEIPTKWRPHYKDFLVEAANPKPIEISMEAFRQIGAPTYAFTFEHFYRHNAVSIDAVANVRLASFGIQSEMDAFTAYQEISMALNILQDNNDPNPRVVGGDEVILRQKGFDEQSFRNAAPSERKARRKANRARKRGED